MWSKISPVISSSEPRSVLMHSMPVPQIRTIPGPVLSIQGALLQTIPPFYFIVAFPLFSVLLGILYIWHVFMPNPNYPLFSILLPKGPSMPPIFWFQVLWVPFLYFQTKVSHSNVSVQVIVIHGLPATLFPMAISSPWGKSPCMFKRNTQFGIHWYIKFQLAIRHRYNFHNLSGLFKNIVVIPHLSYLYITKYFHRQLYQPS